MDFLQQYKEKGLMGRVGFGENPCVLVIDLSKSFTDPNCKIGADLTDVIENTNRILEVAREKKIKVFFTVIEYKSLDEAGLWIKKIPALRELIGKEEIDERLNRRNDEQVIVKRFGSCFAGTPLIHELVKNNIDTLIITGTSTSGCVRATAVDALQNGFRVIVPREAVGDRANYPHEANLIDIDAKYGDVTPIEEVIAYLKNVKHDNA